jgi:hypothetical protein
VVRFMWCIVKEMICPRSHYADTLAILAEADGPDPVIVKWIKNMMALPQATYGGIVTVNVSYYLMTL